MLSDDKKQLLEYYNEGLAQYKQRKFVEALSFFKKASDIDATDGPTKLYISRCEAYIKNPPPADWDGVFTMTTK